MKNKTQRKNVVFKRDEEKEKLSKISSVYRIIYNRYCRQYSTDMKLEDFEKDIDCLLERHSLLNKNFPFSVKTSFMRRVRREHYNRLWEVPMFGISIPPSEIGKKSSILCFFADIDFVSFSGSEIDIEGIGKYLLADKIKGGRNFIGIKLQKHGNASWYITFYTDETKRHRKLNGKV